MRRLLDEPLTLRALAEALHVDAPAATVAANDLEARGLVQRQPHQDNRRAKLVSLTPAGRRVVAAARRVGDRAPAVLQALAAKDITELKRILESLQRF